MNKKNLHLIENQEKKYDQKGKKKRKKKFILITNYFEILHENKK